MIKKKKGVSPIIATVLLIMIVIILAIIILLWAYTFVEEAIVKEIAGESKEVSQLCSELSMAPIINEDGSFGVNNNGNIPIYSLNLKLVEINSGSSEITKITPDKGGLLNPGYSTIIKDESGSDYVSDLYEEIKIIPILLGKTESGEIKEFECPEINGITIK